MSKLDWILTFLLPNAQSAVQILRRKDANRTGKDDLAADALEFRLNCVRAIQDDLPLPELPESLRPKAAPVE
jgi:hypothetical protein